MAQGSAVPEELIAVLRERPWDRRAVEAIATHFDGVDKARAHLVRLQLERDLIDDRRDPRRDALQQAIDKLIAENQERWIPSALGKSAKITIESGLIDSVSLPEASEAMIEKLQAIREVRKLEFDSARITSTEYGRIAKLPYLDYLRVYKARLDEACINELAKLAPHVRVRVYGDESWNALVEAMNVKRVARFDGLNPDQKRSAAERFFRTCEYYETGRRPLTKVRLIQTGVHDHEMRLIAELSDLEEVDIHEGPFVTDAGIAALAGLKRLKSLKLFETKVKSIASLTGLVDLRELELFPDLSMGERGVEVIEHFPELETFVLRDSLEVHDQTIRRLGKLTKLKKLQLTADIQDPGCLGAIADLTELVELDLRTNFNAGSLRHLSGSANLERLDLTVTNGDGREFRHLAGMKRVQMATFLGDGVTDEAIGHLTGWTELRTLMLYDSKVTRQAAEKLARSLPSVTIITNDYVVKSPRTAYEFRRHRVSDDVSLLVPSHWTVRGGDRSLRLDEDGWEKFRSAPMLPASIHVHLDTYSRSPQEAMKACVENYRNSAPVILDENVLSFADAADSATCVFRSIRGKNLVGCAKAKDGILVFRAVVEEDRFVEFERMFRYVAKSVRISDDPQRHTEEKVEVPAMFGEK